MKNHTSNTVLEKSMKKSFSTYSEKRKRFINHIERVTKIKKGDRFIHSYIYSPPGIGKTFIIKKQLNDLEIKHVQITGNISMYAFGIQLAVINHFNSNKENVVVFVDDCDSLFSTEENCNMMKNVLEGSRCFSYEKSLQSQWSNLSDLQKEAVREHQKVDKMGFEVTTESMIFIFASNFKLPVDDDIKKIKNKSTSRSILMTHRNAIRSRCVVGDFDLNDEELWEWIADVVINTDCLNKYNIDQEIKVEILDFLWENWESLKERSIRLVEKMANIIYEYPDSYRLVWDIDFLK